MTTDSAEARRVGAKRQNIGPTQHADDEGLVEQSFTAVANSRRRHEHVPELSKTTRSYGATLSTLAYIGVAKERNVPRILHASDV